MSVANATPEQLKQLNDYTVMLRAICGQWMRAMNQMNSEVNSWNATISAIIGTPAGTVIQDNSGLIGIAPLTDSDVTTITSYFENCMSTYYDTAHQQLMTRACGPANAIGS